MIKQFAISKQEKVELDEEIESSLVKLLFDGQLKALFAITFNSTIIVVAQWTVINRYILITWFLGIQATSIWRFLCYRAYSSKRHNSDKDTIYWRNKTIQGAVLSGVFWGAAAFLLVPVDNIAHQAMVFVVLVGMCAGSVVTVGSVPAALHYFLTLVLIPMIIRLFTLGDVASVALGFMCTLYYYYMYSGAKRHYQALVETMKIRRAQEKAKEIIEHQAYHDDLTSLPNRRLLLDRLKVEVARAGRHDHIGAVLFLDLDRFKIINDSLGHRVGDHLLVELSQRLTNNLRDEDTAARLGGDEFILLLSELGHTAEMATANAKNIAENLQSVLSEPFDIDGHHLHVSSSIGIALFPVNGVKPSDLLKHADSAMYQAKAVGRNVTRFFMSSMQEAVDRKLHLEKGLRNAVDDGELYLDFQVLKSVHGNIVGAEGLLRWKHPQVGLIIPETFIPIAEDSELIRPLGQFVLATACRHIKQLEKLYGSESSIFLSINISPQEFSYIDFATEFLRIIKESQINPERLQLELTESTLLLDIQDTQQKIMQLKAVGVKLAIDDFGTGHSSLAYLKELPVDTIKIDRCFIKDMLTEPVDATIVETTIVMAKKLGIDTVAEGVENEETLGLLREFGCNIAQGYYLGAPMAFDTFLSRLAENKKDDGSDLFKLPA